MIKSWRPVLEDINSEIGRINTAIEDAQFNPDFGHKLQIIKMRTHDLDQRLYALIHQMKSEAAAERAEIDYAMAEFRSELKKTTSALSTLRIFRAERARANYLHIMDIKAQAEEGGEK